jgi:hypothetical protein
MPLLELLPSIQLMHLVILVQTIKPTRRLETFRKPDFSRLAASVGELGRRYSRSLIARSSYDETKKCTVKLRPNKDRIGAQINFVRLHQKEVPPKIVHALQALLVKCRT